MRTTSGDLFFYPCREARIISHSSIQFGKIPTSTVVQLGPRMGPAAKAVFLVLGAFATQPQSFVCGAVPVSLIRKVTGYTKSTVVNAISELESLGAIRVDRDKRPGRGRCNEYELIDVRTDKGYNQPYPLSPDSDVKGIAGNTLYDEKGYIPLDPLPVKRVQPSSQKGITHQTPYKKEESDSRREAAAAVLLALDEAGIREPARSRLADLPGVSPAIVRKAKAAAVKRGMPDPVLIESIEQACRVAEARRQQKAAQVQSTTEPDNTPPPVDPEQVRIDAALDELSPAEYHQAMESALSDLTLSTWVKDIWRKNPPITLRRAMAAITQQSQEVA